MPFKKGEGGRPKGVKNKHTAELRHMILEALTKAGGVKYLEARAKDTPGPFLALIGKVLPLQVTGDEGGPVLTRVIHEDASDGRR